jgi:tetratricopeptide (TPR) repeat protein
VSHRPVSLVVPAAPDAHTTRNCLEALRPTLGPRDQVVVLDQGGQAAGLDRLAWVTVVAVPSGTDAVLDAAAELATADVVVLLDPETFVPARWLEGLLRPFDDDDVTAVGPVSNAADGRQLLPAGSRYDRDRTADVQRFARDWRRDHGGERHDATGLDLRCVAVRRSALAGRGDLAARLGAVGGRLVVARDAFVHATTAPRTARTDVPLVSACLIVKDEEAVLQTCLDSLVGFADEVVVYDTGSTDRTVEIARASGALVVEGHWDDDFSRARNASLDHCTGEWILHIDADETVVGDPAAARALLADPTTPEGLRVAIDNVGVSGKVELRHWGPRMFRRVLGCWTGRIHEQVVNRAGVGPLTDGGTELVTLRHTGYQPQVMLSKGKRSRNLRLSQAEADATGGRDRAVVLLNLGRSLLLARKPEEALQRYTEAAAAATDMPVVLRRALRYRIKLLLDLGRPAEVLPLVADLRAHRSPGTMPDYYEGLAHLGLGDMEQAARFLGLVDELVDEDGSAYPVSTMHVNRGVALAVAGSKAEAADEFLLAVRDDSAAAAVWAVLADLSHEVGRNLVALAAVVEEKHLMQVLGQLGNAAAPAADELGEQLWLRFPDDVRLLAFATQVGPRLAATRAMEWSARLRSRGLTEPCPLVARAADETVPALERLRAACVAHGGFADPRAAALLPVIGAALVPDELEPALVEVDALAPDLVVPYLEGAAYGPGSCLALARALEKFGARQEALAVFDHGFAVPDDVDSALAAEAQDWLRTLDEPDRAELSTR